ncbi:hypothetical protein M514_12512 [Trichuris suis]|uniref:Uncharacterized protein n=1 Tax=Trichuris suis TaxID=68888 RepID=A0A085LNR7_9BILA|nr:hypothetical protein M513_12512 [Trichuris suis]KFD63102.1 hypothetical protein M514_12512 [Trichuris suis]
MNVEIVEKILYAKTETMKSFLCYDSCVFMTTHPLIAQLAERWTVAFITWISIGRWFKSGSEEYDAAKMATFASES